MSRCLNVSPGLKSQVSGLRSPPLPHRRHSRRRPRGSAALPSGKRPLHRDRKLSGLERVDRHDAAVHLPVVQILREDVVAANPLGGGDNLRVIVLNAVDPLYLNGT